MPIMFLIFLLYSPRLFHSGVVLICMECSSWHLLVLYIDLVVIFVSWRERAASILGTKQETRQTYKANSRIGYLVYFVPRQRILLRD